MALALKKASAGDDLLPEGFCGRVALGTVLIPEPVCVPTHEWRSQQYIAILCATAAAPIVTTAAVNFVQVKSAAMAQNDFNS